jgi:hypothetical protein
MRNIKIKLILILIFILISCSSCQFFDALNNSKYDIDIIFPDEEGLVLNIGFTVNLRWEYYTEQDKKVKIEYCENAETCKVIEKEWVNTGTYEWFIDESYKKDLYFLKISDTEYPEGLFDISKQFEIKDRSFFITDEDSPHPDYTNEQEVILNLEGVGGATEMRFANDNEEDLQSAQFIPYQKEYTWTLSEDEGNKIVYAEFKDENGETNIANANITLDKTKPSAVNYSSQPRTPTGNNSIIWVWETSSDNEFFSYQYKLETNGTSNDEWLNTQQTNFSLPTEDNTNYQLFLRVMDKAGNTSDIISSILVYIDKTPPSEVNDFSAETISSSEISLSWENPIDDFMGVLIIKHEGDTPIEDKPSDGVNYSVGSVIGNDSTVIYNSNLNSFVDGGLNEATEYHYKAFVYDTAFNYSNDGIEVLDITYFSVYVKTNGDDDNGDGSQDNPYKTIQKAINEAYNNYLIYDTRGFVKVSAGNYNESIELKESISIYGGYNKDDWDDRDNIGRTNPVYKTVIIPKLGVEYTILCDGTSNPITQTTEIDGFTLNGNDQDGMLQSIVIKNINASPQIKYNTINGMGDDSTASTDNPQSFGIYNFNSSSLIKSNYIRGGNAEYTYAIYNNQSSPIIKDNSINGGSPKGSFDIESYGIYNLETSSIIDSNIIIGGFGVTSISVKNVDSSNIIIQNNTIESLGYILFFQTSMGILNINSPNTQILSNDISGGILKKSYGIKTDSFITISKNKINANGNNQNNSESYGIYIENASPDIFNNAIIGGLAKTASGIWMIGDCAPSIINNTVKVDNGGSNDEYKYGLYIDSNDIYKPSIINNIISLQEASIDNYGIYEASINSSPLELRNNNIIPIEDTISINLYYDNKLVPEDITDISTVNSSIDNSSDNISVYVELDGDLRIFNYPVDTNIANGGLDKSSLFTTDKDEYNRTTPWSIGAYEYE